MSIATIYSEQELLQQMVQGSEAAFSLLYEQYHHALFRNVMRLVHSEEEARDVVQEVFITLWEKRLTLNTDIPVNGWLFTLSYNRSLNHLKKKLRQEALEQVAGNMDIGLPDTDDAELANAQWKLVEEAITRLSPQKRKVFELCRLQGFSYDKAAHELGISKHTVSEYLQQAMTIIRQYIKDHPSCGGTLAVLAVELFFK